MLPVLTWLVTGAGGMLGRELLARLSTEVSAAAGSERLVAVRRPVFDVTEPASVGAAFAQHRPNIVINCAAYTAVEAAERDEATAWRVNGAGAAHVAEACARYGARLIHVSTDYVFSGHAHLPYPEYHPTGPGTAYGRTKLVGERAVLDLLPQTSAVVRTAWLYGAHGRNFVRTMLELEQRQQIVEVVADQFGQPTWAADLTGWLTTLGRTPHATGIFHGTNAGMASWYELATAIFTEIGADPGRVHPTTTEAYPGKAPRPRYTVLGHDRWAQIGVAPPRDWHEALRAALAGLR